MTVKVYGREGCSNCMTAQRTLRRAKIDYEYLHVDEHKEELAKFEGKLSRSLPHIIFDGGEVVMFHELDNKIKEFKKG